MCVVVVDHFGVLRRRCAVAWARCRVDVNVNFGIDHCFKPCDYADPCASTSSNAYCSSSAYSSSGASSDSSAHCGSSARSASGTYSNSGTRT